VYHSDPNHTSASCREQLVFLLHTINSSGEVIMLMNSTTTNGYNDRQICLINYLESRAKAGKNFFKSKYIARETGLSPKEVGTNMGILAETCPKFTIEKYSYSNSTTWLITPSQI
jgi:hypothetical protein